MPTRSRTPLIRNVFGDDFDDSVGDRAAKRSLMNAHALVTRAEQRAAIEDLFRRLRRIEQAVAASRAKSQARDAGAFGEGASLEELRTRLARVKALTSPNVTPRSRARVAGQYVTGRSRARTRRMTSR